MICPSCGRNANEAKGERQGENVNLLLKQASCVNPDCPVGPFYSVGQTADPRDTIQAMKQLSGQILSEANELEEMWTRANELKQMWTTLKAGLTPK